jgi:hypothetical protein
MFLTRCSRKFFGKTRVGTFYFYKMSTADNTVTQLNAETVLTNELQITGNFVLKGVVVVTPKSGNRIKIGTVSPGVIIAPNGPLHDVTIIFPEQVSDGQIMFISFTQDVKRVHFTNGNFANKATLGPSVSAGDSITLFYHGDTGKWFKLA